MNGLPIVSPEEMVRLERKGIEGGGSQRSYMELAAQGIAKSVSSHLKEWGTKKVHLLIGKGNNGGDALAAGSLLAQEGIEVIAYLLYPLYECSPLAQEMGKRLEKAGATSLPFSATLPLHEGVIIDGLVGTGFHGAVKGQLAVAIEWANASRLPIFAIDIPSGLDGYTGHVDGTAIRAFATLFLTLPKMGFFIGSGWDFVGKLIHIDFGLSCMEQALAQGYLFSEKEGKGALPQIKRRRHKYERGYLLAVSGSDGLCGAPILATESALKAGAGIVRLFYPNGVKEQLAPFPLEIIREGWDLENDERILQEAERAKALIIGPGIGREEKTKEMVKRLLSSISLPSVIDGDALYFLAQDPQMVLPKETVLTPHWGEMHRILGTDPTHLNCQDYVEKRGVTLVLKGAPTTIFHPRELPLIIAKGDPAMATAGSGDVLTGIIGALLAQRVSPRMSGALAALLHGLSGESGASEKTSHCLMASDLIAYLPKAFQILSSA